MKNVLKVMCTGLFALVTGAMIANYTNQYKRGYEVGIPENDRRLMYENQTRGTYMQGGASGEADAVVVGSVNGQKTYGYAEAEKNNARANQARAYR